MVKQGVAPSKEQPVRRPQIVTTTTRTAAAAGSSSELSLWMKLTMALVALFLGLLTPPLLVKAEGTETMKGENEDEVCYMNDSGDYVCATQTLGSQKALFPCEKTTLSAYLNVDPFPGYHVVCFSQVHNEEKAAKDFVQVTYYLDGFWNKTVTQTFPAPYNKWKNVKKGMERLIKSDLRNALTAGFQPWAMFTPLGHRVVDADLEFDNEEEEGEMIMQVLMTYQTMLVFEGGQFIWPGIKKDFIRQVPLYSVMPIGDPDMSDKSSVVSLRTLSIRPLVLAVDGFLTDEECDYIQKKAEPDMEYSGVVLMDKDKGRPASDFRTSQTAFVSAKDDDILLDIEYRVASLARVPRQHQEDVQVLRYGIGEK
jgi:prolyl 4-hydroxylase